MVHDKQRPKLGADEDNALTAAAPALTGAARPLGVDEDAHRTRSSVRARKGKATAAAPALIGTARTLGADEGGVTAAATPAPIGTAHLLVADKDEATVTQAFIVTLVR